MSGGTGAGVPIGEGGDGEAVTVVGSWVAWGVRVTSAGAGVTETGCEVAGTGVGVSSGAGAWPMQAANTMRNVRNTLSGSLVIGVLPSFLAGARL